MERDSAEPELEARTLFEKGNYRDAASAAARAVKGLESALARLNGPEDPQSQ
jgi:hypothetical protein